MKSSISITLFLLVLLFCACTQEATEKTEPLINEPAQFDESQARADIMAAIEQETKCFFERNYDCWQEHWIHEAYAFQAWNNSDGTFSSAVGWDKINQQGKGYIDVNPVEGSPTSHPVVKREDLQFKFYGPDLAYLVWKQYNSDRANEFYSISQETRLMEKQGDHWKIVNVTAFWDEVNKVPIKQAE